MAAAEQDTDAGVADAPAGTKTNTTVRVALPVRGDAELVSEDDVVRGELELDETSLTFYLRPLAALRGATSARTVVVALELTNVRGVRAAPTETDAILVELEDLEVTFRVSDRRTWIDAVSSVKAGTAELVPTSAAPVAEAVVEPEVAELEDGARAARAAARREAAEVARAEAPAGPVAPSSPDRWIRRGVALFAVALGWGFILMSNRFHLSPSLLFVGIGWVAIVAATYFLWRTGAAAAEDIDADGAWWKPAGRREELEREKRALLKAIKEVEFDQELRKLSAKDANEMMASYRARAIEVIKALDSLDDAEEGGEGDTVANHIDREVRARIQIKSAAGGGKAKKAGARRGDGATAKAAGTQTSKGIRS